MERPLLSGVRAPQPSGQNPAQDLLLHPWVMSDYTNLYIETLGMKYTDYKEMWMEEIHLTCIESLFILQQIQKPVPQHPHLEEVILTGFGALCL